MTRKIKNLIRDFSISSFNYSGGMGGGEAGVPDDLLTTKGDTHGFTTENARVPIGANNQVLTADSTEALGLKWDDVAAGGKLELIEALTLGSANNKIITTVSVDTSLYSKILIDFEVSQSATTATAIGFRANANTGASQLAQGYESNGATLTAFGTNTNYMEINPSITWSANESLNGEMSIFCPTEMRKYFGGFVKTYHEASGKNRVFGIVNSYIGTFTHSSYEIFCVDATLTFKAGSWLNVYGVKI